MQRAVTLVSFKSNWLNIPNSRMTALRKQKAWHRDGGQTASLGQKSRPDRQCRHRFFNPT